MPNDESWAEDFLNSMTLPQMQRWACEELERSYAALVGIYEAIGKLIQAKDVGVLTADQEASLQHLMYRFTNFRTFVHEVVPPVPGPASPLGRKPLL
jgi:hypothetical protein